MSPLMDQLLYEIVAMKVFTPGESEFSNPMSVQRWLRKEVLVPLRRALSPASQEGATANKWGYDQRLVYCREPDTSVSVVHKYMVALRTAITAAESKSESVSESMIEAGAVLPHGIALCAVEYNGLYEQAAELQWKRMTEDVYKKQGRLNNCLAVCDAGASVSVALELFVSQLSQGHCLEECEDWEVDPGKVFDLILEAAVNENVKAEKMVRKVFVFTFFKQFSDGCWKPRGGDYEEIQRKFKEKGYAVPHLVIWNLISVGYAPWRTEEPGVTLLGGFSEAMLKCFLDNDGQLDPDQVMELDISGQGYQTLAVFD
ncbi:PREDICTED: uncharacterized protein LOC103325394 [Prunus mume]|uniref:Uncharacterized protein LOC103325394 n=1 Tax=Prunus mume TaxID=102107 RepID=A0ABM0NJM6_PRUMU|nr:PREDICTED: uncharacterized protein LOC103325394 [Prunus mume]